MNSKKEKEELLWRQQKYQEIKQELLHNETFMKFIEKGRPSERESFIDEYATKKVDLLEFGPSYVKWNEDYETKWIDDATERLQEIKKKKLFDIQCLWRAEKITIKEIKLTYDFHTWSRNIFSCPFIEPVSEAEVDIYIQYLQSENFQHEKDFFCSWQDHRRIKDAYNNDNAMDNFPEWYDFHNGRTGMSIYLQLPDIRGEKEENYLNLWRTERFKNVEIEKKIMKEIAAEFPLTKTEYKPHISHYQKGWMTWFVNTFEDKQTQEMFARYGGEFNYEEYDHTLDNDLSVLANADRIMPMQGWFDWREAVQKAADRYRRDKIIEVLPSAYQQYRVRVDTKLGFKKNENRATFNKWYKDAILRGRELNGEKRDFDF